MGRSKKVTHTIIFASPENYGNGSSSYYTDKATVTDDKYNAAIFMGHTHAQKFADEHAIELGGVSYIGQETFDQDRLSRCQETYKRTS